MQKMEYVKEMMKQTLKNNWACCCAKDATFECRNCQLTVRAGKGVASG